MKNSTYWAHRNATTSYAISAFENASASLPIWLLFFTRQLGLSVTAAIILGMSRWATMAVCNVPTGAWADRFGRVKIYRLGQFFYALSYLPFLLTRDFSVLLITQIIAGFVGSMSTGTMAPLVKDSYTLAKFSEHSYTKYLSTSTVVTYCTRLLAGIFGAWLYVRHPYGPYVSETVVLSGSFLCALLLKEFRVEKSTAKNNFEHIKEALGYVWRHTFLRNFFIAVLLTTLSTEAIWTGLQPAFIYKGIAPQYFGLLFGIIALLSALAAYISRRIVSNVNGLKLKLYTVATALVSSCLFLTTNKWLAISALIPLGFSFGFIAPVDDYNIQHNTGSKHQATVLSLYSLLTTSVFASISVLVGRYVDLFGTGTMLKILAIQAAVCAVIITVTWSATRLDTPKAA